MKLNEYQELATRTADEHENEILNYALGLNGEAGEVADIIKKVEFHRHIYTKDDIKKELGDVLWYVSQIARLSGITLEDVAKGNIDKLKKRYPTGFNTHDSINRGD
ncbi:MAG TPA: nucleoside triphosphate pyrophosphohydrolase family protein [Massilibacterium sp.]|nr:nucleoside triphosphate pyrophosphohydrolase family protein [Massilibacterium sp.]